MLYLIIALFAVAGLLLIVLLVLWFRQLRLGSKSSQCKRQTMYVSMDDSVEDRSAEMIKDDDMDE